MEIKEIEIKKIEQNKNVRIKEYETDGEMAELMDNIRQVGLLQPVGVVKKGKNYEMLFGNRRLVAMKKLGRSFITARIFDTKDEEQFLIINLIENVQRKDVGIVEQGRIMNELIAFGLTQTEIAARLSISTSRVKTILNIYKVPKKYIKKISLQGPGKELKKGRIPASLADKILNLNNTYKFTAMQLDSLFKHAMKENFSNEKLRIISVLLKNGYSVEEAIDSVDKVNIVRVNFPINKLQIKKLEEQYKKSIVSIIHGITYGDINEKLKVDSKVKRARVK